ncbi:hypothetical protein CGC59_01165 [Capnocytophaga sputigena]|jgi:hypothetical protein|uniref:Uncharacterized protein n=1 Tax=Capnocytophaga sputigena TaxID=1019 RepID=A0A250EZN3_CAPSP|nr:hypothetical protein [Capnocytophaga sputigena]ATA78363.1 hypothetical protein CGC59_01165 [Capnocytophaga sputigena]
MNIEELISKGENFEKGIYLEYKENGPFSYEIYKSQNETEYENWISLVKRFIRNEDEKEFDKMKEIFEDIDPKNHTKILATLRAIKEIPNKSKKEVIKQEKGIHINITQSQNQQTSVSINLIIEAFQDELNGKQQKEIQTIIDDKELEPEKKKSKIVETLKKFGGDVASNILANILTNPSFFGF